MRVALATLTVLSFQACAGSSPSEPLTPAPAPPVRLAEQVDGGADAAEPDASDSSADADAASEASPDAPPAPKPSVSLLIEKPYLGWARPRPKGEVAAGAHDELIGRWNVGGTSDPDFPSNRPGFHPGTRVKVDTRVVAGRLPKAAPVDRRTGKPWVVLSETSLLARSRKLGYWHFRLCYEAFVQANGPTKGGETSMRFRVGRDGRIGRAQLVKTKLDSREVVGCLLDRVREIELLPPAKPVDVELSVQVWPGDVPLPSLSNPPADRRELDADALEKLLEGSRAELEACGQEAFARDAGLWGRVQLHLELRPDGGVARAKQSESRFPDDEVTRCVIRTVSKLAFPARKSLAPGFEVGLRFGHPPEPPPTVTP